MSAATLGCGCTDTCTVLGRTDRFLSPTPGRLIRMLHASLSRIPLLLSLTHIPFIIFLTSPAAPRLTTLHIGSECSEQRGEVLVSHHNNGRVSCILNTWRCGMTHRHRMCTYAWLRTQSFVVNDLNVSVTKALPKPCSSKQPQKRPLQSGVMNRQEFLEAHQWSIKSLYNMLLTSKNRQKIVKAGAKK